MQECKQHQLAAVTIGIGAGAVVSALLPTLDPMVVGVTALSGYTGALLPDIDDPDSVNFRIIRQLTRLAAIIVPAIQFSLRPTDLLLAIPVALLMVARFWDVLRQVTRRGGGTHSVLAALCLSMGVAWVAYLTAGYAAAVPAFVAAGVGYVVHLLLDDLQSRWSTGNAVAGTSRMGSALTILGRGKAVELYGLIGIGGLCALALWVI